ncbi:OsmC family protein [Xanthovirga aplysinae]|uniref:OsmC family protein n=1 Tax=Xanthovirga aplysinae TaxID=2529853 RepID=UPI0012BBBBDE|nr:OsmC family protein [Xanthovirga aplysinae]MTI29677.1 OsmC family peroxiredoxin [Xanthovirga aplysinae]
MKEEMEKVSVFLNQEDFKVNAYLRNHQLTIDEPIDKGGKDKGPSPFELLCVSLASCTAITLKMYINLKEWEVDSIRVEVEHTTNASNQSNSFYSTIFVEGNLDDKQKGRLLAIAKVCPVHKTLNNQNSINTKIL